MLLSESAEKINTLTQKLGKHIETARPYYISKMKAKQVSFTHSSIHINFIIVYQHGWMEWAIYDYRIWGAFWIFG